MVATLERPAGQRLGWRQRYQRWIRLHLRHTTRQAVVGAVACAVLVVGGDMARGMSTPPQVPEDETGDALVSAAMVGDIMYARHVEEVTRHHGDDYPMSHVEGHLRDYDYVTGNLEQAVLDDDPASDVEYVEADKLIHLASGPSVVDALADAGFTNLNLANNHTMDYGQQGLVDTLAAVQQAGLDYVGAGPDLEAASEILYDEIGGVDVATIGFTDAYVADFTASPFRGGVLSAAEDVVGPAIREARDNADLVIAHIHWGQEYAWRPNSDQTELGRAMAEEGADIVVGHHPHVLHPVEVHEGSLIFYSLGNFVFDQGWTRTRESVIAGYELSPDGTATVELTPLYITEGRPQPLEGLPSRYRQERIFAQMTSRTDGWERDGDSLTLEIDHSHILQGAAADGE